MDNFHISKEDFEAAIPVAMTKNNDVYDMLLHFIRKATAEVSKDILGSVGIQAVGEGASERLVSLVKAVICLRAFLPNFRSLDVVLTATGFGVVSTQDTAPASKMRTDALKSQLDIEAKRSECDLLERLFGVAGWNAQPFRSRLVPTLFFHFDFLSKYAGKESPTVNDWRSAQPLILEADALIRKHIGEEQADAFLDKLTSNALTAADMKVVTIIQQLIGMHVCGDKSAEKIYFHRLINTLEGDLENFQAYRDSEAYRYNHFEDYENTKDSGMFLFNG